MTPITNVIPGDIVQVDKRGRKFLAEVTEKRDRALGIKPLPGSNSNYYEATSREVIAHYKKMGRPRVRRNK